MPPRAKKPCTCPGCPACAGRCPNIVARGRCAGCGRNQQATLSHDPERKRIYNHPRWRALRRQVRRETAWCAIDGCGRPWTDLDHDPPLREILAAGGDPFARSGVQPLCHRHHSAKTLAEARARKA